MYQIKPFNASGKSCLYIKIIPLKQGITSAIVYRLIEFRKTPLAIESALKKGVDSTKNGRDKDLVSNSTVTKLPSPGAIIIFRGTKVESCGCARNIVEERGKLPHV